MKRVLLLSLLFTSTIYGQEYEVSQDSVLSSKESVKSSDRLFWDNEYAASIIALDVAIELNPNNLEAILKRGYTKFTIEDYKGAEQDYNYVINNYSDKYDAVGDNFLLGQTYWVRGMLKGAGLGDYKGACEDYKKSVELGETLAADLLSGCELANKISAEEISQLGSNMSSKEFFDRGEELFKSGRYRAAIEYLTKGIETHNRDFERGETTVPVPNSVYYYYRASAKESLGDFLGSIEDYTTEIELCNNYCDEEVQMDVKRINYYYIGRLREILGDLKGACEDYKKSANLGETQAANRIKEKCN